MAKRQGPKLLAANTCSYVTEAKNLYIQSLWLTSWLSSGSGRTKRTKSIASGGVGVGIGIAGQEKRSVNVYTLQQPHKFPLQLDVCGGGNCSFDCHQKQQREQQELDRIPAASLSWSQRQRRQLRQSCDETKFIESSMAQTMDDMVFQCNNQNSIYVLNASYGAYGDYGTYAATKREINGSQSRAANPIEATCPSGGGGGVVLQHKFKTFGTPTTTASEGGVVDAAAGSASNYVNPVATSMSTAMCSPATAALQKLFNCSVGGACHDVPQTHAQAMGQIQDHSHITSHHRSSNNSNNNAPASSHNNSCLSAASGVTQNGRNRSRSGGESLDGTAGVTAAAGAATGGLPLLPKKKCTNVKSALIAKKTKFLKYLEEEKWRSNAAAAATATEDAGTISNEAEPPNNNGGNLKNQSNSREAANRGGSGSGSASGSEQRQLNKLSNWSMHNQDNNATASPAALTSQQQPAKSSFELYQEAADILGLSCSLCDNCRCLDCQSGYFDCDDDDESYSEQSLMDDEYEFEFDCTAEELQAALTGRDGDRELEPCCQLPHNGASPDSDSPHTQPESDGPRLAIDFDLINATCSQVLQNCETFNELSLLDATAAAAGVERPYT